LKRLKVHPRETYDDIMQRLGENEHLAEGNRALWMLAAGSSYGMS